MCGPSTLFDSQCFVMDDKYVHPRKIQHFKLIIVHSTINRFPSIELTFTSTEDETVSLTIPPTNYFIDYGGKACLALEMGSGTNVVIGNTFLISIQANY